MKNEKRRNRERWVLVVVLVILVLSVAMLFFWRMLQRELGLLGEGIQSAARATAVAEAELPVGSVVLMGPDTIAELKRVVRVRTGDAHSARVVYVASDADPGILIEMEKGRLFGAVGAGHMSPGSPAVLQLRVRDQISGGVIGYLWFTNSGVSVPVHLENSAKRALENR